MRNVILSKILWGFDGGKRTIQEEFVKELVQYNLDIDEREIDLNEIVIKNREITVAYEFYNEEDEEIYRQFRLIADNVKGFTIGELLYKIHNEVIEDLENEDGEFFEGLTENGEQENIPLYDLNYSS